MVQLNMHAIRIPIRHRMSYLLGPHVESDMSPEELQSPQSPLKQSESAAQLQINRYGIRVQMFSSPSLVTSCRKNEARKHASRSHRWSRYVGSETVTSHNADFLGITGLLVAQGLKKASHPLPLPHVNVV